VKRRAGELLSEDIDAAISLPDLFFIADREFTIVFVQKIYSIEANKKRAIDKQRISVEDNAKLQAGWGADSRSVLSYYEVFYI
jgi:hypothetical protein